MTFEHWERLPAVSGRLFESLRWIPSSNTFQWVDILEAKIYRTNPASFDRVAHRSLDLDYVTCALPLDEDRSLLTSRDTVFEYSWNSGELRPLISMQFPEGIRFNDGNLSPSGTPFIGTMSMLGEPGAASLYAFEDALRPIEVLRGVGISNGLVWVSDNEAAYVDSMSGSVDRLRFVGSDLVERSSYVELGAGFEPDGLAIDPRGDVWVALWGSSAVAHLAFGEVIAMVEVPGSRPTSIGFGGGEMLVTIASDDGSTADGVVIRSLTGYGPMSGSAK